MVDKPQEPKAPQGIRYDNGPVIAVSVAGRKAAWCDGVWAGDSEVTSLAQTAAESGVVVQLFGTHIQASNDSHIGILAALAAWSPGRCIVEEAPNELLAFFDDGWESDGLPATPDKDIPDTSKGGDG